MSKILRRPMFRGGGKVSSYGNGITTGLANGGRVNLNVGGLPDWAQNTQWSKQNWNPQIPNTKTGLELLQEAYTPKNTWLPSWIEGNIAERSNNRARGWDTTPVVEETEFEEINKDQLSFPRDVEEMGATEVKTESDYVSPTMTMKQAEMNQGNVMAGTEINKGEVDIIGAEEDSGIEAMADEYFKLMGGDKARGRDISDMLLRFSGAEGDTVQEKFKEFTKKEADVKSRTEDLKQKATGFAIQQDAQLKMLQKKLDSAESIAEKNLIGQQIRDHNKTYAPGITEKKLTYIKTLNPNSTEYKLAMKDIGLATSFDGQINKDNMSGMPLTVETIDTYADIYYPTYKGKLTPQSLNGRFFDVENNRLLDVDSQGNVTLFKTLPVQK